MIRVTYLAPIEVELDDEGDVIGVTVCADRLHIEGGAHSMCYSGTNTPIPPYEASTVMEHLSDFDLADYASQLQVAR